MFVECEYPVFAVIRDVTDQARQSLDKLRVAVCLIIDACRTHVDLEFQTMKRMRPSVHLRVDERVRAARANACDVNVVIDELVGI